MTQPVTQPVTQTGSRALWAGAAASLAWGGAFVVGRTTGHVYAALGMIAAALAFAIVTRDDSVRTRLWPRARRAVAVDVGLGVAFGVASVVATEWLFPVACAAFPSLVPGVRALYALAGVHPAVVPVVVVVACAEELVWRGLFFSALRPRGAAITIAGSAAAYALAQSGGASPWLVLAAASFGVAWGALAWVRPTLWASLVAHLIWTLTVLGARPLV